jgi:hypothetical protein
MTDYTKAYREKTGKKVTALDKKLVTLVYNYLLAKRNKNIKREHAAHEKLSDFCDEYNISMQDAVASGKKVLKYNIAAQMNLGI